MWVQHIHGLEEDADVVRDLETLSTNSQARKGSLEQEETEAFTKIEQHQLKELSDVKDVSESARKARKRRHSQHSADSTPNGHLAPKRHTPEKPVDGHGNGNSKEGGRRADDDNQAEEED